MALFDLNDDKEDQEASKLAIELNSVDAVLGAGLQQDEAGTYVEAVLDEDRDRVPASIVWPTYSAEFGIANVSPQGTGDDRHLVVEVRP
ncbi:hypothetical protein [Halorarum salinum]|uniref:Uncharacterized protein n=1 Tax=Halorarum salinum TaxID=2743089 RepID=A0A7D5QIQ3_9EURY|nr:hypothetical protein [Halobaculum salinum]QLG63204.1 hypothetical protein HUG12_16275 [Halobaculum salinum]